MAALLSGGTVAAGGPTAKPGAVAVALVSESAAVRPGRPFWVALRMDHDAHWHTYWKNPGDAGVPTTLAWTLPPGLRTGDLEWPHPTRLPRGPLASYGYEGRTLLPVPVFAPPGLRPGDQVALRARAAWLECRDTCVPREADLRLELPVADGAGAADRATFDEARARLPQALDGSRATARRRGDFVDVTLDLPPPAGRRGELFFETEDVVEPGHTPVVTERTGGALWTTRLTANGRKGPARTLPAVWVAPSSADGRTRAWRIQVDLR